MWRFACHRTLPGLRTLRLLRVGVRHTLYPQMLAVISGLAAGVLHVLSGPDHLAAIAPLAVHDPRRSWRAGVRWGLGHSAGVFAVGLLMLAVRELIPFEALSAIGERLVGVVLIGVGLWGIRVAFRLQVHTHAHEHDGSRHAHVHLHTHPGREHTRAAHGHPHAAFGIGVLHGFAGSAHFLGLLPALAFPTRWESGAYLAFFGIGTVAAMAGFSSLVGFLTVSWGGRLERNYRGLMFVCSALAVGVGGWWLVLGG